MRYAHGGCCNMHNSLYYIYYMPLFTFNQWSFRPSIHPSSQSVMYIYHINITIYVPIASSSSSPSSSSHQKLSHPLARFSALFAAFIINFKWTTTTTTNRFRFVVVVVVFSSSPLYVVLFWFFFILPKRI